MTKNHKRMNRLLKRKIKNTIKSKCKKISRMFWSVQWHNFRRKKNIEVQSYVSFVAEVHEWEIFGDHGEDGDEGRLHRVRLDQVPVPTKVAGRIHDALENKKVKMHIFIHRHLYRVVPDIRLAEYPAFIDIRSNIRFNSPNTRISA